LATLLLELSLTRIFSVVLFYHYAFLVSRSRGVFSYRVAFSQTAALNAVR
jgi:hypothetical protein